MDNIESTAMAIVPTHNNMTAIQLCENMPSVNALGQTLAQSGFFGQVSAPTATAALVNCFLEGLTPLQYKSKYHTFENGQTGIKSDFIQREFHKLGGSWKFNQWDGEVCDMTFTYKGESLNFRVTLDEFKQNGVAVNRDGKTLKTNWFKFPREMLKARCMATAIRAICPEAMDGLYTKEEVADFTPVAETVTVASAPQSEAEAEDFGICPCGKNKGRRWEEFDTETLKKALAVPEAKAKSLTPGHRNAIVAELAKREQQTVDAEVVKG